ncbi:MAG: SDR family oxidoreductase [Deltaproteobacteria bacterium]|nr:SDR family oxidoreductase [Deltaproteobacteria bacterium]
MGKKLSGRIAVVTGAGSGIGAATAKHLHDCGARVCLIARSEDKLSGIVNKLNSKKKAARYFLVDVCEEEKLINVREEIERELGKVDILVTCAAAAATAGSTEEFPFEEWKKVLSTDLDGVFLSCKVFGKSMIENGYGRIVNMTSFHNIGTYPERAAYNAAKSGVMGLTRALAVEWGHYGITINAVAPGPIRTPRTSWFLSKSPDVEKGMLGRTPNVRLGEVEDVATLIGFLVSTEAKHINGQEIVIDGGWTKNAWWGDYTQL